MVYFVLSHIVDRCIGIVQTINSQQPTANSQQSTANSQHHLTVQPELISTINTNSAAENLAVNLTLTVNCASGGDRRKIDNKLRIIAVKQPQSCFSVESNPCSAKGLSDRSHL